jgi:multidrug efflux pump subunit AcrA (membrane-fusion protein)
VAIADPRILTGKRTYVPLGGTSTWRSIICVLVAAIAASATAARQHITADSSREEPVFADSYLGITRPRDVDTLALPAPVVVQRVMVEVGDRVRAGQPLLILDDADARRAVGQLQFDVQKAKTQVTQLERTVELLERSINARAIPAAEANAKLAVAQRAAETVPNRQAKDSPERALAAYDQAVARERRLTMLATGGVVARQELEDAQIAVRVAADDLAVARRAADAAAALAAAQALQAQTQADLQIAEQQRQRQERIGELTQARLRQTEAEHELGLALERLNDLAVRAPGDALVAEVLVRPGDRLLAGAPLVKLATVNPMIVDVDVPPSIVNGLARGDAALVRVSGSVKEYEGRIKTIAPLPGDAGAHTVEVEFDNPTDALLAGQTARVRLTPHRRS